MSTEVSIRTFLLTIYVSNNKEHESKNRKQKIRIVNYVQIYVSSKYEVTRSLSYYPVTHIIHSL